MILRNPIIITHRLMPGVMIDGAFISIEYFPSESNRQRYHYALDIGSRSHEGDDLASGVGGGSLQFGLKSLLAFLSAAGESYGYQTRTGREGESTDLFPAWVSEWAYQNSDELSLLAIELEENSGLIDEND